MKRTAVTSFIIGAIIFVGIGVGVGYALGTQIQPAIIKDKGTNLSDISAVFVNGGGIYFGKITQLTDTVLSIDNVYTYGVVPTDTSTTGSTASTSADTKPTLFDASKVGIAPASHYNINRSQVILWYSLSNDSTVVKTIQSYQSNNQ